MQHDLFLLKLFLSYDKNVVSISNVFLTRMFYPSFSSKCSRKTFSNKLAHSKCPTTSRSNVLTCNPQLIGNKQNTKDCNVFSN